MGLKIEPSFNSDDIMKLVNQQITIIDQSIIDVLKEVGEQFVADARDSGTYNNRTGNLRSSIGYVITLDNEIVYENFKAENVGTEDGQEGVDAAIKLCEEVAEGLNGYNLIVVAGMNYAAPVESKGYDVISGSSLLAKKDLKQRMDHIREIITGK